MEGSSVLLCQQLPNRLFNEGRMLKDFNLKNLQFCFLQFTHQNIVQLYPILPSVRLHYDIDLSLLCLER